MGGCLGDIGGGGGVAGLMEHHYCKLRVEPRAANHQPITNSCLVLMWFPSNRPPLPSPNPPHSNPPASQVPGLQLITFPQPTGDRTSHYDL